MEEYVEAVPQWTHLDTVILGLMLIFGLMILLGIIAELLLPYPPPHEPPEEPDTWIDRVQPNSTVAFLEEASRRKIERMEKEDGEGSFQPPARR